jgi:1-deoxy-D-xylulose-5-phosphate synthase
MTQVESRAAPLLASVCGPEELRRLPRHLLPGLAQELRTELVRTVLRTGGHLGPNLGVVELTIALHRVFESPRDVLLWDVGHQAYVHKMLTGRLASFGSLRREGGLSGYPCRAESEHDVVENSHASTALSYADGLAKAFALTGRRDRRVVAVVGDGALTGGLSWEALNNLGAAPDRPVVVVLNDNGRSYDETAGRVSQHLRELREGAAHGNLFESLGLCYLGPVDGHDVDAVERVLRAAAALQQPVVVHVVTRKGHGHLPAELDEADRMHTVAPHGPATELPSTSPPPWTEVFGDELALLGDTHPELVAITAAMLRPTGLLAFSRRHPDRTFDVGIAEQHAVASAAGLAAAGLHPVVAIYSTFLNRAFDQVLMDVALHRSPVTFVLDRAGITGPDGPSHHGMWDLGLLGLVPGLRLAAPRDAPQLRALLEECVRHDGPTAIRFPRGTPPAPMAATSRWGTAHVLVRGDGDVLLVALGPLAEPVVEAARVLHREGIRATVVDPRWVSPLDPELVERAARHPLVVTVEDNAPAGGLGDMLARSVPPRTPAPRHLALALPDSAFVRAGDRSDLLRAHGLDAEGICRAVRAHACTG